MRVCSTNTKLKRELSVKAVSCERNHISTFKITRKTAPQTFFPSLELLQLSDGPSSAFSAFKINVLKIII